MAERLGVELGEGIIHYDGPITEHPFFEGKTRFLDVLWLPKQLDQLTVKQVCIINRHRERCIDTDARYISAQVSRAALGEIVSSFSCTNLLEIGSGKYPIDHNTPGYLAVDIDEEAVQHLIDRGIKAIHTKEIESSVKDGQFDLVASCFAMHFEIEDGFISEIGRITSKDAVLVFNLIDHCSGHCDGLLERFSNEWPVSLELRFKGMARRERVFLLGKALAEQRITTALKRRNASNRWEAV